MYDYASQLGLIQEGELPEVRMHGKEKRERKKRKKRISSTRARARSALSKRASERARATKPNVGEEKRGGKL
jgi:hypothetical protein